MKQVTEGKPRRKFTSEAKQKKEGDIIVNVCKQAVVE
jgi:hypothetical protein